MWEVMSYGERPYWDMNEQEVNLTQMLADVPLWSHHFLSPPFSEPCYSKNMWLQRYIVCNFVPAVASHHMFLLTYRY